METEREPAVTTAEIVQAVQCALAFLRDFTGPEKEQIPFLILAAMAEESTRQLSAGVPPEDVKFDSLELTNLTRKTSVVKGPAKGKESDWITKNWKKLDRLLGETREAQESTARQEGYDFTVALDKEKSHGGYKLRSYYRLVAQPISTLQNAKEPDVPSGFLRYQIERRKKVPWIGRLYIGVPLGRSRVFLLLAILALFLIAALLVWSPLILQAFMPIQVDLSRITLGLTTIGGVFYLVFGPLFHVATWKVAAVPILFQPGDEMETLLLEEVKDPAGDKSKKRFDLVKYTGKCPVCNARVVVGSGGLRFWARLVGRCKNSPREHVFSFDHFTKIGAPLFASHRTVVFRESLTQEQKKQKSSQT